MANEELPTDVIERARRGDHAAFRRVVERYQAGVFKLAFKMTSDRAEAADLTQEAFLRIFRFFHKFDPRYPLSPWLYKVATNVVLNRLKARRPPPVSLDAAGQDGPAEPAASAPPALDTLAQKELHQVVREAVTELKPNHRAAVTLFYLEELSIREVADALDVPQATAKVWLFRGRQALKDKLANAVSGEP